MITRAQLADELPLSSTALVRTYVVEVHAPAGPDLLSDLAGADNVHETRDAYLFAADARGGRFWVDQLDDRFWSFHTADITARDARSFLEAGVDSRRDLDWMWLPSAHLRSLWPGAVSTGAQTLVEDDDFGRAHERVNRRGRFAVTGDSLVLHMEFVRSVVHRYRCLITACEERILGFAAFGSTNDEGGGTLTGKPIVVRFSRPIPDIAEFLAKLLSAREPFRLWGPQVVGEHAVVEAVDLHAGQRVRLEVGDQWMRIYLLRNSCGNTVARLVSNLQHTFDAALSFADPDLNVALSGGLAEV